MKNVKSSLPKDSHLYLTIVFCFLLAGLSLQLKLNKLETMILSLKSTFSPYKKDKPALEQNLISSKHLVKPHDHNNTLASEYCGISGELAYLFRFKAHGKLSVWTYHLSEKRFPFPPPKKPNFVSEYFIKNGHLHWSIKPFGTSINFKAPLVRELPPGHKQLILNSYGALFSPLNCRKLSDLIGVTTI